VSNNSQEGAKLPEEREESQKDPNKTQSSEARRKEAQRSAKYRRQLDKASRTKEGRPIRKASHTEGARRDN